MNYQRPQAPLVRAVNNGIPQGKERITSGQINKQAQQIPNGMNINGKIVPFRNDAQALNAYNQPVTPAPQQMAPNQYVMNNPVARGIRGGINSAETAIGNGIYNAFPKQKGLLDKVADLGNQKFSIPQAIGNGVQGVGNSIGGALKLGGQVGKAFLNNISGGDLKKMGVPSYKKGGKMKKDGLAYLHKGERVLTKSRTDALEKKKGKDMTKEC